MVVLSNFFFLNTFAKTVTRNVGAMIFEMRFDWYLVYVVLSIDVKTKLQVFLTDGIYPLYSPWEH